MEGRQGVVQETEAGTPTVASRALVVLTGKSGKEEVEGLLRSFGDVRSVRWEGERALVVYEDLRCAVAARRELVGILEARDPRGRVPSEAADEGGRVVVKVEVHLGSQDLFHMFSTYGDVRSVQHVQGAPQHRLVEFYDLRAAADAVSSLARAAAPDPASAPTPTMTEATQPSVGSRSEEERSSGELSGCVSSWQGGGGSEAARRGWCCSPTKIKASDSASSFTAERSSLLAQVRSSSAAWAAEDCAPPGESSPQSDVFGGRPLAFWGQKGGVDPSLLWQESSLGDSGTFGSDAFTSVGLAGLHEPELGRMEEEEAANHLLPPDLYDCMNCEKDVETGVGSAFGEFWKGGHASTFQDPVGLAWPGGAGDCWSQHKGCGLGPSTALCESVVPYCGVMDDRAYLAQYYHSMNESAMVQQAIGREVLKRLTSLAVGKNMDLGLYPQWCVGRCEEACLSLQMGRAGRPGWGGADKGARRKGARYGRKGACADPVLESERRTQQERMFALDLTRIYAGQDKRTTLMIKNIPNKYTQKMLLLTIEEESKGTFDFFYLPIDFKNRCNVGYGFINMIHPDRIPPFVEKFHSKRWDKFNSEKICCIAYARIQGRAALINHFQNSSLMQEDSKHRPLLFSSDGTPDIFPVQMIA